MSWRHARALDTLRNEVNARAPRRSRVSDGTIGDTAHENRDSDHNPWVVKAGQGIVRAVDFTHDPAGGCDCGQLAVELAAIIASGTHPAARSGAYVIWNRRILSYDRRHEGWRAYTGPNPHTAHLHLSVTTDPAGFDTVQPWGVLAPQQPQLTRGPEVDHALADLRRARRAARGARRQQLAELLEQLRALPAWPKRRRRP